MKRLLLLALSLSLALNACMPAFLQQALNPTPAVNAEATSAALNAPTLAQPTQPLPTASPVPSNTPVVVASTSTRVPTLTPGASNTPAGTATPSATPVPAVSSATPTLGVRFFGTLPPLVPSGTMVLINRSHAEAYVSFQCTNLEGTLSIAEYPVGRWMEVKISAGKCKYVAWVGGREFSGSFTLDRGGTKRMVFFLDRVMFK